MLPDANADIATIIDAWNAATDHLAQTHEILHAEVRRLNDVNAALARELERKSRLADLGMMASHIAHEVRNGLVPVTLYLSLLKRRVGSDLESLRTVENIQASFTELEATLNDLLHFTSDRRPEYADVQVDQLVETLCQSLLPQLEAQQIITYTDLPDDRCVIRADREMLRRAVLNLLLNATDVMPGGGELCVALHERDGTLELSISDTGSGFSDESLKRATDPFYSTKGTGTGLGLAIVSRIVESHNGQLNITNNPDVGATVSITLPIV